ncbi:MAG: hypothetical protein ACL93V_08705 [Candidatus Electrothrix sp. YB6]
MKRSLILSVVLCCSVLAVQAACASEDGMKIKKADIPNANRTGTLASVMKKAKGIQDDQGQINEITGGTKLTDEKGNIVVVDDLDEPTCVFYGNYNEGDANVDQYFNIDKLEIQCN